MSFNKCFPVLVFSFLLVISIFGFFPKEVIAGWIVQVGAEPQTWLSVASSSDGTKLVAGAFNSYIYTSINSGTTWVQRTNSGLHPWMAIASSSDGTKLVAGAYSNYIHTSIDSGETWTQRTTSGSRKWTSITSDSDGIKLAAVVDGGYIYTSSDSGATWTQRTTSGSRSWSSISSSSDGTKLAAVNNGGYIYTSIDSGATWTQQNAAGSHGWYSIASSSDGTKLVAVGFWDYIYTSIDSGYTWEERSIVDQLAWQSVSSSSDGTKLVAVTSNDYIYTSADSGATWIQQNSVEPRNWLFVASSSDGMKFVVVDSSDGGFIYMYQKGTPTVPVSHTLSPSSISQKNAVLNGEIFDNGDDVVTARGFQYGLDTNYGITTTESGSFGIGTFSSNINLLTPNTTYHYRSYATNSVGISYGDDLTFKTLSLSVPNTTSQIETSVTNYSATLNGNIVDNGGTIVTARGFQYGLDTNYGITTTESGSFGIGTFSSNINLLTPNTTYHYRSYATNSVGTSYGQDITFISTEYAWVANIDTQKSWNSVASSSDGIKLAAVVYNGYIYTSSDSGATWIQRTTSGSRPWRSIASSSDGTKLAAVDIGGYIYTSSDSGANWIQRITSGLHNWYSITSSTDGTKLAAVSSGNDYVYTSIDSGENWIQQTSAGSHNWYSIASSSDGTKLAAVTLSNYLYYSINSGLTWTEISGFGFYQLSSILLSSDGTKIVVGGNNDYIYTSIDSGITWTKQVKLGQGKWYSVASSSDGIKIIALDGNTNGCVYMSVDSGSTWIKQIPSGSRYWRSISSSSDGTKLVAASDYIYIYKPISSPVVLVENVSTDVNKATVSGFVNTENITRGLQYGLDTNYGQTSTETGSFIAGTFTSNISSLVPDTTYHYRVYAVNTKGTGYTADQTFTTAPVKSKHSSGSSAALIAQFQAEQKALTISTPVITTPTTLLPITRTLKYKMTGDDVKSLQVYLNTHGYPVSTKGLGSLNYETSYFGPATKKAVILFQTANKLTADGIVGAMTRGVMK